MNTDLGTTEEILTPEQVELAEQAAEEKRIEDIIKAGFFNLEHPITGLTCLTFKRLKMKHVKHIEPNDGKFSMGQLGSIGAKMCNQSEGLIDEIDWQDTKTLMAVVAHFLA